MMEFIDAISIRLNEVFGDGYTIYLEAVEQNLQTPCFFIQPMEGLDSNMIHNRKSREYPFVIDYIPDDESGHRAQFAEVSDKLFESFDFIELGDGTVHPTFDRSINVTDDILHFIVRFKYEYITDISESMQESMEMTVIENGE